MKVTGLLIVVLLASIACSREKKQTASVVFEIAPLQQKSSDFSLLDFSDSEDSIEIEETWSAVVPTGITTGDYPINCYAVMVSGPEASLNESSCGRKSASTVAGTTATDASVSTLFRFGPWAGGVYSGAGTTATVNLDVPAGNDRVFRLIGFHALSQDACTDFKSKEIKASELSKPFVIGIADRVTLAPGETKTVIINQSLNSEEWFDDCQFKDVNNNPKETQAEIVGIKMVSGIDNNAIETLLTTDPVNNYKCELYRFNLLDKYYKPANHDEEILVSVNGCMNMNGDPDCSLNTPVTVYLTYNNCITEVAGTGQQSFKMGKGDRQQYRWIRSPKYGSSYDRLHNAYLQATGKINGVEMQKANVDKFLIRELTDKFVKIDGPKNIIKDVCYKYTASYSRYSGLLESGGTIDAVELWADDSAGSTNITTTHVFSDAGCTNAYTLPSSGTWTTSDLYIKAPSAIKLRLKIMADAALSADDSMIVITPQLGTNSLRHLRFDGPNTLASGTCKGPFSIRALNENGSAIIPTAASSINVKLKESSPINFYSNSGCTGLIDMMATGLNISPGETEVKFYLKTNASADRYMIKFNDGSSVESSADLFVY